MAAATAPAEGIGVTLTFSGLTGNIISVQPSALSREMIDTTHQGTTNATTRIAAALYTAEPMTVTVQYDPTVHGVWQTLIGLTGSAVLTFATTKTWTATVQVTKFQVSEVAVGSLMTAEVELTPTGAVTGAVS